MFNIEVLIPDSSFNIKTEVSVLPMQGDRLSVIIGGRQNYIVTSVTTVIGSGYVCYEIAVSAI